VADESVPKRMRQLLGAAEAPVAHAAKAPSLGGLPDELQLSIALMVQNPGDLRQVNRNFKGIVAHVEKLRVHGPIRRDQFENLLQEDYPGVRDLAIGPCPDLTPSGIVIALDGRRDLRAIRTPPQD